MKRIAVALLLVGVGWACGRSESPSASSPPAYATPPGVRQLPQYGDDLGELERRVSDLESAVSALRRDLDGVKHPLFEQPLERHVDDLERRVSNLEFQSRYGE